MHIRANAQTKPFVFGVRTQLQELTYAYGKIAHDSFELAHASNTNHSSMQTTHTTATTQHRHSWCVAACCRDHRPLGGSQIGTVSQKMAVVARRSERLVEVVVRQHCGLRRDGGG